MQSLIKTSHPRIKRRAVSETLAFELGLTNITDSSRVGNTNKYNYGEADILYVHLGLENNPTAEPLPGQRKVVINPSPKTLLRKMDSEKWANTMVVFVGQQSWWNEFKSSDALNYLAGVTREQRAEMGEGKFFSLLAETKNVVIRNVHGIGHAESNVREWLGPDMQRAQELRDLERGELFPEGREQSLEISDEVPEEEPRDPAFNLQVFLDHETGMDEMPDLPPGETGAPDGPKDLGLPYSQRGGMYPLPFGRDIHSE